MGFSLIQHIYECSKIPCAQVRTGVRIASLTGDGGVIFECNFMLHNYMVSWWEGTAGGLRLTSCSKQAGSEARPDCSVCSHLVL